ncbi:MAG: sulfatase-like hydrolase/transferase [Lachnospiraceae bacterium]|nr:sulfatase-like hydrolase/transferase [Lachnospiraceae bacterium]
MILECHGPEYPMDILVPKYNYKGYHAYDENGNECELKDGIFDVVSFKLPANYNGKIYIKYIEPLYWRVAEMVSLVYIIYILFRFIINRRDVIHIILPVLFIIVLMICTGVLIIGKYRKFIPVKVFRICFPVLSVVWFSVIIWNLDRNYDMLSYFKGQMKKSEFIENNYVDPRKVKLEFPEKKRNLIYIFVESVETTVMDIDSGGLLNEHNYIPEMTKLVEDNIDFSQNNDHSGAAVSPASGWTVAGMVAELGGMPLKMYDESNKIDNSMEDYKYFLPGMTTLGDILYDAGYNNYFMCGSDIGFGGRRNLLLQHGNYEIFDLMAARKEGKISQTYFTFWGFEDSKLYEYAKEKITMLSTDDKLFNFTMLTVDTHMPEGYNCPLCNENDCEEPYGRVWHCASRQLYSFVEWCKQQEWYDNTTIVICGDHCSMNVDFYKNLTNDKYRGQVKRGVYNCFINCPSKPVNNKNRKFTTMDIYPTTLAGLNVKIEGERLSLGTNLFSDKETLAEEYGYDTLFEEIDSYSDFYNEEILYP